MRYTVNTLAKISGVSVRTLHWYDEIGILKPAYYEANGYRYYEEEQLLLLQQILFFRELGFSLNEIKRIVESDEFDKIEALQSHQRHLEQVLDRTHQKIKTIEKTISHLRGQGKMKGEELYYGFDSEQQKQHEKTLVDSSILTQEFLDNCNQKIKNWSVKEKNAFIQDIERIMNAIILAIENSVAPDSEEVQSLIRQHYVWLKRSWTPTHESYLGLIDLYQTPEFRTFYDNRHPKLLVFMVEAMKVFAKRELS
jgi:DNA-binding transcriptional MerR regulator